MKAENINVSPIMEPQSLTSHHATVISVTGQSVVIDLAGIPKDACIAFSCLVRPEPNDIVICSQHESGMNYILGIIERPDHSELTLDFPGDTTLKSNSGSLSLLSGKSVNMMAADKISCLSDQVIHKSRNAVVDYNELTAQGESMQASFTNIRVFSHLISTMAKQVIDKFRSYIRHCEESDMVKAGQMTRDVSGLYSMDSKYTVMVSKKDTKIDGERIHMG